MKIKRNKRLRQGLWLGAAGGIILLAGWVHGNWTQRWKSNHAVERTSARLQRVSLTFDGWQAKEQVIDREQLTQAQIMGYRRVTYRSQDDERITLLVLCGDRGPLSVHTPEQCYSGAGYRMVGKRELFPLTLADGSQANLWTARFYKPKSPGVPPLRIFWTWNPGTSWQVTDWPRWTFREAPSLVKLYAVRELRALNESPERDPCLDILKECLPKLQREVVTLSD